MLYINNQLVATSDSPGFYDAEQLQEISIKYPSKKKDLYTIIIYDDNDVHLLVINVKRDDLTTGDHLVEFTPFKVYPFNYDCIVYIYEQPGILQPPSSDFDMDVFSEQHKLKLMYTLEIQILQQLDTKYTTRHLNKLFKSLAI